MLILSCLQSNKRRVHQAEGCLICHLPVLIRYLSRSLVFGLWAWGFGLWALVNGNGSLVFGLAHGLWSSALEFGFGLWLWNLAFGLWSLVFGFDLWSLTFVFGFGLKLWSYLLLLSC